MFARLLVNIFTDFWRYYIKPKTNHRKGFAFLAHPRDLSDIRRLTPVFNFLPDKFLKILMRNFAPFTVTKIIYGGAQNFIISLPLIGPDILQNKELAVKLTRRAFKLADRRGVKVVGLGAYTASITFGGAALLNLKKKGMFITTGNALTALVAVKQLKNFLELQKSRGIDFPSALICAVVGASGSTGRGITELILNGKDFSRYILIGKTPERLISLENDLAKRNLLGGNVLVTNSLKSIKNADIIFVATSSHQLLIKSNLIKHGAIICDITQPRNVSRDLLEERLDVKIIDGGLVETPKINYNGVLGLPPHYAFACLAETIMLSSEEIDRDFIGMVSLESIKYIENIFPKYGFKLDTFLSFGEKMI